MKNSIYKILIAITVLLMMLLISCDSRNVGGHDTNAGTDNNMPTTDNNMPTDEVISWKYYGGNAAYFYTGSHNIVYSMMDEPGHAYYLCSNPTCNHMGEYCPTYNFLLTTTLVVQKEGSRMPRIYMFGRRSPYKYVDGEFVKNDNYDHYYSDVKVYDVETGEGGLVAETNLTNIRAAWYYEGKIFMWADSCRSRYSCVIGMVDTESGRYKTLSCGANATAIGIYNDRLYYITDRGVVSSCDLEFSDIREEYDCGISSMRSGSYTVTAYVDCGMMYFERNCRIPDGREDDPNANLYMVSDVYAVDIDNKDAGERLVAKNVSQFKPRRGDLYYTVWKYDEYGTVNIDGEHEWTVSSIDGGTLYRYDHKGGESSVCFSDCGTSILHIFDVADDYILFEGRQYRDTENCKNYDLMNYMCACDIDTGEWKVLYHTTLSDYVE